MTWVFRDAISQAPFVCQRIAVHFGAQRLPGDFEPFYAIDIRKRVDVHEGDTPTQDGDAEFGGEKERRIDRWCFHILFTVFSNRCWDRLYLVVGLLWSVLCPGYLDSRVAVGRAQLATLMSIMFALAATPATFAVLMKSLFNAKLRRRLQDNRHTAVRPTRLNNV